MSVVCQAPVPFCAINFAVGIYMLYQPLLQMYMYVHGCDLRPEFVSSLKKSVHQMKVFFYQTAKPVEQL